MTLWVSLEQAEMLESMVLERLQKRGMKKEDCAECAILYASVHKDIEEATKKKQNAGA